MSLRRPFDQLNVPSKYWIQVALTSVIENVVIGKSRHGKVQEQDACLNVTCEWQVVTAARWALTDVR